MDLAVCVTLLWQNSKWYWLKQGVIGLLKWSFVNPIFPGKLFQSALVYGNASMLNYMLGTAYILLCVPLLRILDTRLAQIGEISGAVSTDLLQCHSLGQPHYFCSYLQLHG